MTAAAVISLWSFVARWAVRWCTAGPSSHLQQQLSYTSQCVAPHAASRVWMCCVTPLSVAISDISMISHQLFGGNTPWPQAGDAALKRLWQSWASHVDVTELASDWLAEAPTTSGASSHWHIANLFERLQHFGHYGAYTSIFSWCSHLTLHTSLVTQKFTQIFSILKIRNFPLW